MANLDFFSSYHLSAVVEEIVPQASFFKDRYFPTTAADIFSTDKVLTEYRKGDRKMAAFVAPRSGGITLDRRGYEIHELTPAYIELSRVLTLDELTKRGFGEALYSDSTQAQRAVRLQLDDFTDMDRRIRRREEWMAAQTMIHNGCTMQEYIDSETKGEELQVRFYDGEDSGHLYVPSGKWDGDEGEAFFADVHAMCKLLSRRGLPATDLIVGCQVGAYLTSIPKVRELLDNRRMTFGGIDPTLTAYHGVVHMGTLNFDGFLLNIFCVDERYEDEKGVDTPYFPETSVMVTAPDCGAMKYGAITQIDHGRTDYSTYAAPRVPRLVVKQAENMRQYNLATRPIAVPKNYCPYIYAADVL